MTQYNPDSLRAISAPTTKIVDGQPQSGGPVVRAMEDIRGRIKDLKDMVQAQASMQAASGAPANREGGIWHDTANNKWFGDPDGQGYDDDFMNRTTAKGVSFATGGTGTIKIGGLFSSDQNTYTSNGTVTTLGLVPTLFANTITTGNIIRATYFGTKTNANGTAEISARIGAENLGSLSMPASATLWRLSVIYVVTAAATQDWIQTLKVNRDDGGTTTLAEFGNGTYDTTGAGAGGLRVVGIHASDVITLEGAIAEILH